jgi:type I restriction enzyme, R subunit
VGGWPDVGGRVGTPDASWAAGADTLDHAVRQLVSKAIASDRVIDGFAAAGIGRPDVSILSDEFLAEVEAMPHRNVALELLKRLLTDEIATCRQRHLVQAKSFAEMLERVVKAYDARAIEAAQVIEALIDLARKMNAAQRRGEELGLNEDEVAFYEALEVNDSAVKVLGEPTLKAIARELVRSVQANRTIDWTIRESVRAKLRVIVKRILRKHGYPPDKQEKATQTVLEQAELLEKDWARTAA